VLSGVLAGPKDQLRVYPPRLKHAVIAKFLFAANFMLELAHRGQPVKWKLPYLPVAGWRYDP
jgi:hypothetical protein